jgi:hypothetical protein
MANNHSQPLPRYAFHLADAENWPLIQRDGLFSTDALIARAGLSGKHAEPFRTYRSQSMQLPSGAWIRDQRPMAPAALARCLDPDLDADAWYALVNAKVFFWLSSARLDRHRAACGARPQIVLVIDLPGLLARHGARACVTPFNVGNARRRAASRGRRTFVPLESWLATRWAAEARPGYAARSPSHPPAELTVDHAVADLMDFVVDARLSGLAGRLRLLI